MYIIQHNEKLSRSPSDLQILVRPVCLAPEAMLWLAVLRSGTQARSFGTPEIRNMQFSLSRESFLQNITVLSDS